MNLKNIYTTLCLSALAIVSCSKDKPMLTGKTEPGVPVAITVSDGGYDNDAVTRTVENGFVTKFTAGDACGLYVTQNGKVTSENIKLTLTQADGKLDGLCRKAQRSISTPPTDISSTIPIRKHYWAQSIRTPTTMPPSSLT